MQACIVIYYSVKWKMTQQLIAVAKTLKLQNLVFLMFPEYWLKHWIHVC